MGYWACYLLTKPFSNFTVWKQSPPSSFLACLPNFVSCCALPLKWNALNILDELLTAFWTLHIPSCFCFKCPSFISCIWNVTAFQCPDEVSHPLWDTSWTSPPSTWAELLISFWCLHNVLLLQLAISWLFPYFFLSPFLGSGYWKASALSCLICWPQYSKLNKYSILLLNIWYDST